MGTGYNFKITVKQGSNLITTITGPTGFGNTKAVVVRGLQAKTPYDFDLVHECTSEPGKFSSVKTTSTTTLDASKWALRDNHF